MTRDPRYPFALEIGTEIGGYRIEQVLGAGGFGITYRGFNEITHKQVAIKEFYIREISTRDGITVIVDADVERETYEYALRKFQEEAQAVVTRFQHRYIIRGENFVRAHNTCYLIMEYVEGSNLDDWLKERATTPSEAEIRPMFEKLFEAVDYVHHHNTMHRDLTPRNIMVRPNGDPVLIDFGAAGLGIDLGRSSKIVAQMRYAPPEQSDEAGSGVHGRYTDIFSLAGVLYRVVTGRTPMAPAVRLSRMSLQRGERNPVDPQGPVAGEVANPTRYSPQFLAAIDRGLLLDERLRPQSIAEFSVALGWADPATLAAAAQLHADAVTVFIPAAKRPPAPMAPTPSPSASSLPTPPSMSRDPQTADRIPTALDPTVALDPSIARPVAPGPSAPVASSPRRSPRGLIVGLALLAVMVVAGIFLRDDIGRLFAGRESPPIARDPGNPVPPVAEVAPTPTPPIQAPPVQAPAASEPAKPVQPTPEPAPAPVVQTPSIAPAPAPAQPATPPVVATPAEDPAALYALGQATEKGEAGHARSLVEAIRLYERAARLGQVDAEIRLGQIAETGAQTGVPDLSAARAHFANAAEAGNAAAMQALALVLLKTNDGKPSLADRTEARAWLTRAFDAGQIEEAARLAGLLLDGRAGTPDPQKAHAVLAEAAGKGDAAAMIDLARLDFLGIGTARDLTVAGNWTDRAANAGRPEAYARLAALYRTDTAEGRRPDYAAAFLWAQKGAARNEPAALHELGLLYEGGLGRPIDFAMAEEAYQRASDLGFARASYQLGLLAEAGHGRPIDLFRAATEFKRAADQGYSPAMVRYGQLAAAGRGTLRDDTSALLAFTKALQLGNSEGYWQAALLTDAGRGAPRNPQRAASYVLEAVLRGNAHALAAVEANLSDLSEEARRALKQALLARGLLSSPSAGDGFAAPERDALVAAARTPR